MGNKIRPDSFRIGVTKPWQSRWFLRGGYGRLLLEDETIRKVINLKIKAAGVAGIEIERTAGKCKIIILAAKPGVIIGRGGKGIEELSKAIQKALLKARKRNNYSVIDDIHYSLNIEEIKRNDVSAKHLAETIANDLERRMPFRRTVKKYLEQLKQNKAILGAKIKVGGRLDGGEIARDEVLAFGSLPLQTLRAEIDFGLGTAFTTFGTVGIKVWIYKGTIFKEKEEIATSRKKD